MDDRVVFRLPPELKENVEKAAAAVGTDVSGFVRGCLDITTGFSDQKLKDNFRILRNTEGLIKEAAKAYQIQKERYRSLGAAAMAYEAASAMGKN